jgi:hypothetical protein
MRRGVLVVAALAALAICATLSAQGRPWAAPRTADGHPDLQGFWTNDTVTPLERPAEFGNKQTLTPEEAAAYAKKRRDQFLAQPKDNIHYDDAIWQDEHYTKDKAVRLRTSSRSSHAWTRTPSTTTSLSRTRRRGHGRGRVNMRFARSRARSTSTRVMRGTTGWRTFFARSACRMRRPRLPSPRRRTERGLPRRGCGEGPVA